MSIATAALAPLKVRLSGGPYLTDGSLDPIVRTPNGISIASAVFVGLTVVTNRLTSTTLRYTL